MAETSGSANTLELLLQLNSAQARREIDAFLTDAQRKVTQASFKTPTGAARAAAGLLRETEMPTRVGRATARLEDTLSNLQRNLTGDFGKPRPGSVAETQMRIQGAQAQLQNTVGNPFIILSTISQTITGFARLKKELADASAELNRLEAELAGARKGSAKYQRIQDQIATQQAKSDKAIAGMSGVKGAVRAVADFGLNSLITGAFLSVGFQATSAAVEAVLNDFSRGIGYLVDPTQRAREAFDKLGASLAAVGGSKGLRDMVGLTDGQVALLDAASQAKNIQPIVDAMVALAEAQGMNVRTGLNPQGVQLQQSRKDYADAIVRGAGLDTFFKGTKYGSNAADIAMARKGVVQMGPPEAVAAFDKILLERVKGSARSANLGDLEAALRGAAEAAFDATVNLEKIAGTQAVQAFGGMFTNLQENLFAGGAIGPMTSVQTAQTALTDAQARLTKEQTRVSNANAARQRQMQIEEARRRVGQAGVAGAGDTVFDVAQRIINAQAELDSAKRNTQIQGNIAKYTKQVAEATQKLADEKNLAAFAETAPAMVEALKGMTKEQRDAQIQRLLKFEFTGNDKTTKAFAALLNELLTAAGMTGKTAPGSGSREYK